MSERWCLLTSSTKQRSDQELRDLYGEQALVSRIGHYNLIHLDSPTPEEMTRRVAEFDPDDLFEDDCPLCQMLRQEHCDVIYEGFGEDDEADWSER
jgi:hypothetical protein